MSTDYRVMFEYSKGWLLDQVDGSLYICCFAK